MAERVSFWMLLLTLALFIGLAFAKGCEREATFNRTWQRSLGLRWSALAFAKNTDYLKVSKAVESEVNVLKSRLAARHAELLESAEEQAFAFSIEARQDSSPQIPSDTLQVTLGFSRIPSRIVRPSRWPVLTEDELARLLDSLTVQRSVMWDTLARYGRSVTMYAVQMTHPSEYIDRVGPHGIAAHKRLFANVGDELASAYDTAFVDIGLPGDTAVAFVYCALLLDDSIAAALSSDTAYVGERHSAWRDIYSQAQAFGDSATLRTPTWFARPYVYLGFPAVPFPADYDPTRRPWFLPAATTDTLQWSAAYGDVPTSVPVITCSARILDAHNKQLIGVVAVDLFLNQLSTLDYEGRLLALNLGVSWGGALALLLVLSATRFLPRFILVFVAFCGLYAYYLVRAMQWLLMEESTTVGRVLAELAPTVSILNSLLFLLACLAFTPTYQQIHEGRPPGKLRRFLRTVIGRGDIDPEVVAVAITVLLSTVASLVAHVILGKRLTIGDGTPIDVRTAMDLLLSFVAVFCFAVVLGRWVAREFAPSRGLLVGVPIAVYALAQLVEPLVPQQEFYRLMLYGKLAMLVLTIGVIYVWASRERSLEIERGKIRTALLGRVLGQYELAMVVVSGEAIALMSRATAKLLCLSEERGDYEQIAWDSQLVAPSSQRFRLLDFLPLSERAKLDTPLRGAIGNSDTMTATEIKIELRNKTGEPVPVLVRRETLWKESTLGDRSVWILLGWKRVAP